VSGRSPNDAQPDDGLGEGVSSMQHFTCDLCGKELQPGDDQRYVVKIEAYAVHDPAEITEADLDEDHMETVSQLLREEEENESSVELVEPYKNFRYDLCQECHKKFVRDPLARDVAQKLDFSKN
jgi:hypothetical protein